MTDARMKWNHKYLNRLNEVEQPVANIRLKNLTAYLNGQTALDIACGLGGNSLLLTDIGYTVHALDISDVAINYLKEKAEEKKLPIIPRTCDLTKLHNLTDSFDMIVMTYYLDRNIFPVVKSMVKEKGYFFMETFYTSPLTEGQTISEKYQLQPQELLHEFQGWKILFYEENEQEGRQTIFCQKN